MEDIRETGPVGLEGLKGINRNRIEKETADFINKRDSIVSQGTGALRSMTPFSGGENLGNISAELGIGESRLDKRLQSEQYFGNIEEFRGQTQSGFNQLASGIGKGVVLAGTTFLSGTVGTVTGLVNMAAGGSFWDNPFDQVMKQVNDWSEKAMPNYYTHAQQESPWYTQIFSANFIGDKFLKNLGFAVGAYYSGRLWAGATSKVLRLGKARDAFKGAVNEAISNGVIADASLAGVVPELATKAAYLKFGSGAMKAVGSITSAVGEAKIEALNTSQPFIEENTAHANQHYNNIYQEELEKIRLNNPNLFDVKMVNGQIVQSPSIEAENMARERATGRFDLNRALTKIAEDGAKAGNMDFLMNVPLLFVSDLWQFGKMYAGGFKSAKRAERAARTLTKKVSDTANEAIKMSNLKTIAKIAGKGVAEGPLEEMGQAAAARTAEAYYGAQLNSFYGAKIDPDSEMETQTWLKSMGSAMLETYGKVDNWEEGFIGALTGILGIPSIQSMKGKEGKFKSPIYLQGGITEALQEHREHNRRAEHVTTAINKRLQSPEYLNYYQGAVQHNKFQKIMDDAVESDNKFVFSNAEHAQFVGDIITFDNAGRLEDLSKIIDDVSHIDNDEQIDEIRNLTTNQETGKSIYDGMTNDEVKQQIQKQANDMKSKIETYRKIADDLKITMGDVFQGNELAELTWMMTQVDDWETRAGQIHSELKEALTPYIETIVGTDYETDEAKAEATKKITELLNRSPQSLLSLIGTEEASSTLSQLMGDAMLSSKALEAVTETIERNLNNMKKGKKKNTLLSQLQELKEEVAKNKEVEAKMTNIVQSITDLQYIALARTDFINKYVGFTKNPEGLRKLLKKDAETAKTTKETKDNEDFKTALKSTTNTKDFETALNREPDVTKRDKAVNDLITEKNPIAKSYKDEFEYSRDIHAAIENSPLDKVEKEQARQLFQGSLQTFSSIAGYANPLNIEFATPEDLGIAPDAMTPMEFQRAIVNLLRAMNIVNNNNVFKHRFSDDYKLTPDILKNVNSENLSGTSESVTPKTTTPKSKSEETPEIPFGTVVDENKDLNNTPDNAPKGKDRPYYRPAISYFKLGGPSMGIFKRFDEIEGNEGYTPLYEFLIENGAFEYVDDGHLKVGDEIGFMIDPKFPSNFIFMVKLNEDGTHQILNVLDEKGADSYKNLRNLRNKVIEEYKQAGSPKDKRFVASPVSKVSKLMIGKMKYDNTERNLKDVANVLHTTDGTTVQKPIFGIIKNGTLDTNGKITREQILSPTITPDKEGRVYLMVKTIDGKYRPIAVLGKKRQFNATSFNPKVTTKDNNAIYRRVSEAVEIMAKADSEEDVRRGMAELGKVLYTRNLLAYPFGFDATKEDVEAGTGITFTLVTTDPNGKEVKSHQKIFFSEDIDLGEIGSSGTTNLSFDSLDATAVDKTTAEIATEIMNAIMDFNLNVQINVNEINESMYNEALINADIFSTNVADAKFIDNWFVIDYMNEKGEFVEATAPSLAPHVVPTNNVKTQAGGNESIVEGISVGEYIVDKRNRILNKSGKEATELPLSEQEIIRAEAYVLDVYGDKQNGANMIDGFVLLPNGKVYDRNKQMIINGKRRTQFLNDLNNANSPTKEVEQPSSLSSPSISNSKDTHPIFTFMSENVPESNVFLKDTDEIEGGEVGYYYSKQGELHKGFLKEIPTTVVEPLFVTKQSRAIVKVDGTPTGKITWNWYLVSGTNGKVVDQILSSKSLEEITPMFQKRASMNIGKIMDTSDIETDISNFTPTAITSTPVNLNITGSITSQGFRPIQGLSNVEAGNDLRKFAPEGGDVNIHKIDKSNTAFIKGLDGRIGDNITIVINHSRDLTDAELNIIKTVIKNNNINKSHINDIRVLINSALDLQNKSNDQSSNLDIIDKKPTVGKKDKLDVGRVDEDDDTEIDPRFKYRLNTGEPQKVIYDLNNPNDELRWLKAALPQVEEAELIKIQKGLIKVANSGATAWGQFNDGIITLSDISAEGTVYHEAFHVVFNLMLEQNEKDSILNEAKKMWGDLNNIALEEKMADGFMTYMLDNKSFKGKIKNFFDNIIAKIRNWLNLSPSLTSYYYNVSKGKYSISSTQMESLANLKKSVNELQMSNKLLNFVELETEVQNNLKAKGWSAKMFESVSRREQENAIKCSTF